MSKSGHLSKDEELPFKTTSFDILEPDPLFWSKTSWLQLAYGIWANLTLLNIGFCMEFSAVAIPQLKDQHSEITMTKNQEALIASILTVLSPIGCIIAGILLDRSGRKAGLVWCQVPIAIGWIYIAVASNASDIIMGRVITGVGVGMTLAAPRAYISEITLPNMRGVVGALPNLAISIGLTTQAILGSFLDWRTLSYLCGSYAAILLCANKSLPETPYFILLKSSASDAKVALQKFRSARFNVEAELLTLEEFKEVNNIRSLTFRETTQALFRTSACKPFAIILFYITLMQFTGINVITAWAVEMLQLSKSSTDPHVGNVLLGVTRIVVGVVTSFLLYRMGRRPLALSSAAGVGGVGVVLGAYLHTHEGGRTPLIMMIAFVAFAVPGYHTLPVLMMFELFPLQIRGILSGIVLSSSNLLMSAVTHLYPTMRDTMGLANIFMTYGTISLIGAVVLYQILPETHDLTLQEIEEFFNNRRATLVSERRLYSAQMRSHTSSSMKVINKSDHQISKAPTMHKEKSKKKKRLQIVSSQDVSISDKEGKDGMSYDDVIVYYDSDEESVKQNQSKVKLEGIKEQKKHRDDEPSTSKM